MIRGCRRLRANQRTRTSHYLPDRKTGTLRPVARVGGRRRRLYHKPFDIQELRLRVRNSLRRTAESPLNNPVTGLQKAPWWMSACANA